MIRHIQTMNKIHPCTIGDICEFFHSNSFWYWGTEHLCNIMYFLRPGSEEFYDVRMRFLLKRSLPDIWTDKICC